MDDGGLVVAPPGWFADPVGLSDLRWWSGAEWTAHVAPSPTMHPADIPRPGTVLGSVALAHGSTPVPPPGSFVAAQPVTPAYSLFAETPAESQDRRSAVAPSTPAATFGATRWNTVGAWALGATPLIGVVSGIGMLFVSKLLPQAWWWSLPIALLPLLWTIVAATRDRIALGTFGYDRLPSRWWLLVGPLAYLIARTVFVRRQSGRGSAPLWWYLAVSLIVTALVIAAGFLVFARISAALHTG
ncbi:DUF2510 domain-containing protein [Glaciihabitans sp. INWT7]|uniref:DUF2510 domain-containing protein n=1 Tax=Glaciihabitans sp. INWT7 TaxID=2596912 RepID=UPI001629EFAC|nr:DUF2510 domain-containing protein [Glaciihabitans sp. INWT7]QNE46739.1 DUF2510 domain-containing protein [Glaciihabitans sp. INWT7]